MKILLVILCLLSVFSPVKSQGKFMPGFIVIDGVKIVGEIRLDDDDDLREFVVFRNIIDAGAKEVIYKAGEISSFYFESESHFEYLNTDTIDAFYRVLVKGKYSLYEYPGNNTPSLFILKTPEGEMIGLINTELTFEQGGRLHKKQGYEYISSLQLMLVDYPELLPTLFDCKLEPYDLASFIHNFNLITLNDDSSELQIIKNKMMLRPGPYFGVVNPANSPALRTGVLLNFRSSKINSRFQYNIGVNYTKGVRWLENETGQFTIDLPLYASYYIVNNRRINWSFDIGACGMIEKWGLYGTSDTELETSMMLHFGSSLDIEMEKLTLKIIGTLADSYSTVGIGVVFKL